MLMVVVSYILILILAFACVYLPFLALGAGANFQTLALFVAGVILSGSMLWSLVPRRNKFVPPGVLLDRSVHTRLFAEIDEIASALCEPLPREVYLIPEPNAWVADRGGVLGIGSWRIMGLGLPLLSVMNISQFRAILAHEFAHYYGGDTRLGPWLRRAQIAMIRTFQTIGSTGKAMRVAIMQVLYMVVFGILKWYWLLFLRAINFVSRRQEFRADELACIVAGPESLVSGLRLGHGVTGAWPIYWKQNVAPMLNAGFLPSMTDGFAEFMTVPSISQAVEQRIHTEMEKGTTHPFDSHPKLSDRIAAAQLLLVQPIPCDSLPARSLLNENASWDLSFLRLFNPGMRDDDLKRISWGESSNTVLLPGWTNFVKAHAQALRGITVQNLFESLRRIREIAEQIPNPRGMLLTPEKRIEQARDLLAVALGLALIRHGWMLHSRPGELYLKSGEEQLNPFDLIRRLSDGEMTDKDWLSNVQRLGIDAIPLVDHP